MAGALTERVFVLKLQRVGFDEIEVVARLPFPLARAADYPLFTPDLVETMYRLIPVEKQSQVAVSMIFKARCPH